LADFGPFSRRVVRRAAVSLSRAQRYVRRVGPASPITPSVEEFSFDSVFSIFVLLGARIHSSQSQNFVCRGIWPKLRSPIARKRFEGTSPNFHRM